MKKSALLRALGAVGALALVFHLWLKLLDAVEPQLEDESGEEVADVDIFRAQPGDVLLFNRATGLNRLITWFTQSPFYHVGIYQGKGCVVEARPRGVVCRDLNGPDGDKYFTIISAEKLGGREAGEKALVWAQTQIGDGYDPFNVAAIVLDRCFSCCVFNATLPDRWACAELVASAFEEAGVDLFEEPPAALVPADFARFLK